jgi:hypothetical protein
LPAFLALLLCGSIFTCSRRGCSLCLPHNLGFKKYGEPPITRHLLHLPSCTLLTLPDRMPSPNIRHHQYIVLHRITWSRTRCSASALRLG